VSVASNKSGQTRGGEGDEETCTRGVSIEGLRCFREVSRTGITRSAAAVSRPRIQ
jgi:hypothetical protein